jgi:predicted porin
LALATLAACAPAWAQSTVTIYGAVDMAVGKKAEEESTQLRAGKMGLHGNSGVNLQDSFVGFRGVEDLGGGMQVGFQLEQMLDASNGAADPEGAFARGANLWVGGGWGRITLGRAMTPSYSAMSSWALVGSGNNSIAKQTFGAVGTEGERQSNQISYRSPNLGGVVVETAYVPKDDNFIAGANRSRVDLAATYKAGGLTVGAAYNKFSGLDANFAMGAKYIYQNLEFAGGYYQYRNGRYIDSRTGQIYPNVSFGSNGVTVGVKANWNQFSAFVDVARETKSEYFVGNNSFDGKKDTNVAIGGSYAFSKRTQAYINYMRLIGTNNYGVGISHSF